MANEPAPRAPEPSSAEMALIEAIVDVLLEAQTVKQRTKFVRAVHDRLERGLAAPSFRSHARERMDAAEALRWWRAKVVRIASAGLMQRRP